MTGYFPPGGLTTRPVPEGLFLPGSISGASGVATRRHSGCRNKRGCRYGSLPQMILQSSKPLRFMDCPQHIQSSPEPCAFRPMPLPEPRPPGEPKFFPCPGSMCLKMVWYHAEHDFAINIKTLHPYCRVLCTTILPESYIIDIQ